MAWPKPAKSEPRLTLLAKPPAKPMEFYDRAEGVLDTVVSSSYRGIVPVNSYLFYPGMEIDIVSGSGGEYRGSHKVTAIENGCLITLNTPAKNIAPGDLILLGAKRELPLPSRWGSWEIDEDGLMSLDCQSVFPHLNDDGSLSTTTFSFYAVGYDGKYLTVQSKRSDEFGQPLTIFTQHLSA